jgi:hypothetical protein
MTAITQKRVPSLMLSINKRVYNSKMDDLIYLPVLTFGGYLNLSILLYRFHFLYYI